MGKIDELEEDLYGKEESTFSGRAKRRVIFPRSGAAPDAGWTDKNKDTGEKKPVRAGMRRIILLIAGIGILFLAGGAAFVFLYLGKQVPEAAVKIQSRDFLEAGEEFTIPITFANTSKTVLREVELAIALPDGSLVQEEDGVERPAPARIIKSVPDLAPGEEGSVQIATRLFGKEGDTISLQATLTYRPENIHARFSAVGEKQVTIASVPLALSWDAPDTVSQKQDVTLRAHVHSTARASLNDLWLRVEYPSGFSFASGDPKPDAENSLWKIGSIAPGQDATVTIRGVIQGGSGEVESFRGGVGVYNELTKIWQPWREASKELRIAVTPLSVEVAPREGRDHIIIPGQRMDAAVRYRNNSDVALKNISVSVAIEGDIADPASITAGDGGVFDLSQHAIVWGPGGTQKLQSVAPGEGGELTFGISIRAAPAVRTAADKNLSVKIHAHISAASVPQELQGTQLGMDDLLEMKVQSVVLFAGRALFRASPIPGSGPLPPKVGAKTVYTVVWELRNFTNDLDNADVRASLPPNIKWEGVIYPKDAAIAYDAASGEMRWRVGKMTAGVGVLTPALIGAFQVSVVPASSDAGRVLTLIGESRFSAHDAFTGEDRQASVAPLSSETREDSLTTFADWSVVK